MANRTPPAREHFLVTTGADQAARSIVCAPGHQTADRECQSRATCSGTFMDALDAYDTLKFSEQLHERLAAACTAVENKRVIRQEKTWLATARDLLTADQEQARAVIERARMLPELLEVRQEFAAILQQKWVDAIEKLVGGITFHAGSRSPMIETLLAHQKFPLLRKANREAVQQYQADLEKRMKLSYVQRMLTDATFAFMPACFEEIQKAYAEWMTSFSGDSMADEQAQPIRDELIQLGEKVEVLTRQAKLLAEAALLPVKGAFDEYGLSLKPRKRSKAKKAAETIEVTGTTDEVTVTPIEEELPPPAEPEAATASEPAPEPPAPKKPRKKKADAERVPPPESPAAE